MLTFIIFWMAYFLISALFGEDRLHRHGASQLRAAGPDGVAAAHGNDHERLRRVGEEK